MIIIEFNDRYVNHCGGDVDVDTNSHFMEMSLDHAGNGIWHYYDTVITI